MAIVTYIVVIELLLQQPCQGGAWLCRRCSARRRARLLPTRRRTRRCQRLRLALNELQGRVGTRGGAVVRGGACACRPRATNKADDPRSRRARALTSSSTMRSMMRSCSRVSALWCSTYAASGRS